MLYYGAKRYEDAQRHALRAIELAPQVGSYKYNLSLVYEARDLLDLAEQVVDGCGSHGVMQCEAF